jgi:hypothetical protein
VTPVPLKVYSPLRVGTDSLSASTPHEDEAVGRYLLDCVGWAADTFVGPQRGHRAVHELRPHDYPMTSHRSDGTCVVFVQRDSDRWQLRHQCGHEAFHVIWGRNVYHWLHEGLACVSSFLMDERHDPAYAARTRASASAAAVGFSVQQAKAVRLDGPDRLTAEFYGRVAAVASALVDAYGVVAAGAAASVVADAEPARRDAALERWLIAQPNPRPLLELCGMTRHEA